jgi:hypothetical protein
MPSFHEDRLGSMLHGLVEDVQPDGRWDEIDRAISTSNVEDSAPSPAATDELIADPSHATTRSTWRVVATIAAAAVLLVAGLVVIRELTGSRRRARTNPTPAESVGLPFYLAASLPDGLELIGAGRGLAPEVANQNGHAVIVTDADVTKEMTITAVATTPPLTSTDKTNDLTGCANRPAITVHGQDTCVVHVSDETAFVSWVDGGRQFGISGAGRVTDDDLTALAASVVADPGGQLEFTVDVPRGLEQQFAGSLRELQPRDSWSMSFTSNGQAAGTYAINVTVSERSSVVAGLSRPPFVGGETISVNGHDAHLTIATAALPDGSPGPTSTSLLWSEGSNVDVAVSGVNVSADVLTTFARSLRRVSEQQWVQAVGDLLAANAVTTTAPPDCDSLTPIRAGEVQAVATDATVYGLVFMTHSAPIRAGEDVKIVWRMTGQGDLSVTSVSPSDRPGTLTFGPEPHSGSTYDRPGDEWGTGFLFDEPGCWHIHLQRTVGAGDVWISVG